MLTLNLKNTVFLWVAFQNVFSTQADDILNDAETIDRICSVYCSGPILEGVQMAQLFDDSKTFVDMPLLVDPEDALAAWSDSFTNEEISAFVSTYFTDAGSELLAAVPNDWKEEPPLLSRISNETISAFALALNNIWLQLYREMDEAVFENPQRYSLLRRRHGLVLPGGRFRETYYWDSYWIVRGLILSDMLDTATGVVQNLLDDVTDFGFVPNG
jgi:alpha,alpha-trehalase